MRYGRGPARARSIAARSLRVRRPLHRGQAAAAAARGATRTRGRASQSPSHAGPARRPPRGVGGRAPRRDDRAARPRRRAARRLARPVRAAGAARRRRPARAPLRARELRPGDRRGDGLRRARRSPRPSLGPAHIIDDGETGWLFDVNDRAALSEALVAAVNDPPERRGGRSSPSGPRSTASRGRRSPSSSSRSSGMPPAAVARSGARVRHAPVKRPRPATRAPAARSARPARRARRAPAGRRPAAGSSALPPSRSGSRRT